MQECDAGLIRVRRGEVLAFAAPPLIRSGPVDEADVQHAAEVMQDAIASEILDAAWADNGPGWMAVLLRDADAVLALKPGYVDFDLGVVGARRGGGWELRAFFPKDGSTVEDPVTGSLERVGGSVAARDRARDCAVRRRTRALLLAARGGSRLAGRRRDDLGGWRGGDLCVRRSRAIVVHATT